MPCVSIFVGSKEAASTCNLSFHKLPYNNYARLAVFVICRRFDSRYFQSFLSLSFEPSQENFGASYQTLLSIAYLSTAYNWSLATKNWCVLFRYIFHIYFHVPFIFRLCSVLHYESYSIFFYWSSIRHLNECFKFWCPHKYTRTQTH